MAQADYSIANQGFPATRAEINSTLEAIATNNSGTSAPSTQYAGQFWIDTTSSTWTLYIHDGTDDIQFATIDTSANTVNFTDSALDVVTDTTPQLGGDLDLNSNDITGTGNINITGDVTATGTLNIDTIEPQSGTTLTLGASGDTIALASGVTSKINYPIFSARISADQTLTTATVTKVDLDTVMYDTDNAFDTTNNRFVVPTGKGGKYLIIVRAQMTLNDQDNLQLRIYKNGTLFSIGIALAPLNSASLYAEHIDIVDCVEADYIEFFAFHNFGSDRDLILGSAAEPRTLMRGYRIGS